MWFDKITEVVTEVIAPKLKEQAFIVLLLVGLGSYLLYDNYVLRTQFIEYLKTENNKEARDSFLLDIINE